MFYNLITLQETAQAGGGWSTIIMIVALFAIFYFLMIRPQQKQRKEIEKMRNALSENSRVVTAGGIHGVIRAIKENTFIVEIDKNVKIEVDKTSIYAEPTAAPAK